MIEEDKKKCEKEIKLNNNFCPKMFTFHLHSSLTSKLFNMRFLCNTFSLPLNEEWRKKKMLFFSAETKKNGQLSGKGAKKVFIEKAISFKMF